MAAPKLGNKETLPEILERHGFPPSDLNSRTWVQSRTHLARDYFRFGKVYLARAENARCRIAGYAYIARFEAVLDAIERDSYWLQANYACLPDTGNGRSLARHFRNRK